MLYHGIDQPYQTTAVQVTNCTVELVCRTCLKMIGTYFDIFNHKRNNELLVNMLTNCTSVKIQKEDGLPVNICTTCMEKLTTAFDFKMMVIESNTKLCQREGIKREGELCNYDVEDIPKNEEAIVKPEQTTVTDLHCKIEDIRGNQANMEKIDIEIRLESELLDENCSSFDNSCGNSLNLDSPERENGEMPSVYKLRCKNGEVPGNQTRKEKRNDKSDIACTNSDDSPKTRKSKTKEQTAKRKRDGGKDEESSRLVQRAKRHMNEKRTTPTADFHCKHGDILANEPEKEEIDDNVQLELERLGENGVSWDDSLRVSSGLKDSVVIQQCNKENQTAPSTKKRKIGGKDKPLSRLAQSRVNEIRTLSATNSNCINHDVLGNEVKKEAIDDKVRLESESLDKDDSFSDDSVPARLRSENSSKRRRRKQNQPVLATNEKRKGKLDNYDEKHAELLDNPDFKRIMSSGLTKKQKDRETVFCAECNKTISFRYYVAMHAYIHTGKVPYKCDKCEKRFPKESILRRHLQVHIQTKDFACDVCGKSFLNKTYLCSHKARKHSGERPYKCNICDKTFTTSSGLSNHAYTHMKERKYVCETCGKTFVEHAILKRHRESHNAEKNFVCTTCGKAFTTKRALSWHLKVHRGEKSCICSVCGKGFYYTTLLKKHALIHTGEKPYACHICGKTFRQRGCIGRHMRIHTGERPYTCKLCPSSFKYSQHLLNHVKVHEKEATQKEEEDSSHDDPLVDC